MKYAFFTVYKPVPGSVTESTKYKVPIYGCDRLYNVTPAPGADPYILKEGDAAGYDNISSFYKEVCEALTFNPFAMTDYFINDGANANNLFNELIAGFNGQYDVNNEGFGAFYPEQQIEANIIGYFQLYQADPLGTNALTAAKVFNSSIRSYRELEANDGITYRFEIWPEAAIENGAINAGAFFKSNNHYRLCYAQLFIYKSNNKYYYYIKLENYTMNQNDTDYVDNKLDGVELDHIYNPDNPYDNHQADGTEGGNGGFDNNSDPVPVPDLPTLDITANGGLKLYRLSPSDFAALMSYLMSHEPGEAILKWFQNPIQGIVSCYVLPYPVSGVSGAEITVLGLTTGVSGYKAEQWTEYDLGGVTVDYGFGDCFLDYSPWTKVSIYLPFIGIRQLNADEVMGKRVGVHYQFDNVSGACIAFVKVGNAVRYSFAGSCACGIPLAQSNWGQFYIAAATTAAGALAGAVGGAAAALPESTSIGGVAAGGVAGAVKGGGALGNLNAKPTITRSGAISGAGAELGVPYPYLIIERPDKAKVANPAPVTGLTCGRTLSLGSLTGYNIIEHVHLHGIGATGGELEEIERLLYEGVVF